MMYFRLLLIVQPQGAAVGATEESEELPSWQRKHTHTHTQSPGLLLC